jgi:hypothetical protein
MAVNREELLECLNDLIETCRDGQHGFQTAAESRLISYVRRIDGAWAHQGTLPLNPRMFPVCRSTTRDESSISVMISHRPHER